MDGNQKPPKCQAGEVSFQAVVASGSLAAPSVGCFGNNKFPAPRAGPDCFILLEGHFHCHKAILTPLQGAGGLLLLHSRLNKCSLQLHLLLTPSLDRSWRQQVLEQQTPVGCLTRNPDVLFPPKTSKHILHLSPAITYTGNLNGMQAQQPRGTSTIDTKINHIV